MNVVRKTGDPYAPDVNAGRCSVCPATGMLAVTFQAEMPDLTAPSNGHPWSGAAEVAPLYGGWCRQHTTLLCTLISFTEITVLSECFAPRRRSADARRRTPS